MARLRFAGKFADPPPGAEWRSQAAIVGLGLAGLMPPLSLMARPGDLGQLGAVPVATVLTALLILAPALTGLVTALIGLDRVRDSCRARTDGEPRQAAIRVFAAAVATLYGVTLAVLIPGDAAAGALVAGALGLAGAWLFLLIAILDPGASAPRRYLAMLYDAGLLAAFLHFGGGPAAPWALLYLPVAFEAGFRGGILALGMSAAANLAGFAAVVSTTPYWQEQPLLAGGIAAALALLPAYIGFMVHELAASRDAAAAAQSARTRFLTIVSEALRAPLGALVAAPQAEASATAPAARALLSQVSNILDFTAIEAGAFVPATEAFDLHRLVKQALADRRGEAAGKGLRLRCRIDPAVPYRLRGWPQQLRQVLDYLVARAIEVTGEGAVRVTIAAAGSDDRRVRIRLTVRDGGAPLAPDAGELLFDPFKAAEPAGERGHGAFGLAVVRRLVELMGGEIGVGGAEAGGSLSVMLPLALDEPPVDSTLDLDGTLVLIATEDSQFASGLAEPLNAWNADPRWIDSFDGTLGFEQRGATGCSVLIVDGRSKKLAALSFAHRAAAGDAAPSFLLFVTEAAQVAGLIELADDELDAALGAPLDNRLLANALHALPLWPGEPARPVMVPSGHDPVASLEPLAEPEAGPHVTPIAAHPRFAADVPVVDPRAVAALRRLGGGDAFLGEVLDSFRADAKEIMQRLVQAAASADSAGFARGLHALRSCAANLGGTRLCEVLLSLREVGAPELREQGSALVQRLGDELARLDAALADVVPETERASG